MNPFIHACILSTDAEVGEMLVVWCVSQLADVCVSEANKSASQRGFSLNRSQLKTVLASYLKYGKPLGLGKALKLGP